MAWKALEHFAPWTPTAEDPFDARKAAHLLRRAGFGAAPAEIARVVDQGLEATVEELLSDDEEQEAQFELLYADIAGSLVDDADVGAVQAFWIHRMVRTRRPLREKLTLFWHGHFATSYHKVEDAALMRQQIDVLRRLALGNFRDLVTAVAHDPAMLVYLDGESSTAEHPNENFARELMELFTCGIGHYTEHDVLEGARAFTGWHREGMQFVFHADQHDTGRKEFLSKSGRFDGNDIIDILIQQPATAEFMARKLLRFFAAEPNPAVLAEATELFDRTQLDVRWFLRDLFLSRYFYGPECYRRRIASPVEFAIGTVRTLGVRVPAGELNEAIAAMGQELLGPPNVKGWDGEQKWINSATWPARLSFAQEVSQLDSDQPTGRDTPLESLLPLDNNNPEQTVDRLADLLLQGDLPAEARTALRDYLVATEEGPQPDYYREDEDFRYERNRGALATLLGLPEYHAC
jgi:uncharacterized protein (DUF1800 family)